MPSNDKSLQIYSDLLTQKRVELPNDTKISPEKILPALKRQLEVIEELLTVRVSLRAFTEGSLSRLEADLREIIITGIRRMPNEAVKEFIDASEAVLHNLLGACDELNLALEQLELRGKTRQYFKCLRACQTYLKEALNHW